MPEDLDACVERLAARLLSFAFGVARERSLAEDLAQDALVALVSRWRRFGPPESPDAFVVAIVRRRAARLLSRRRRLTREFESLPEMPAPPADSPDAAADLAEVFARLDRLAEQDRWLLLAVASGFDSAEVAATLGLGGSALRMRLLRARQRFARLLGGTA